MLGCRSIPEFQKSIEGIRAGAGTPACGPRLRTSLGWGSRIGPLYLTAGQGCGLVLECCGVLKAMGYWTMWTTGCGYSTTVTVGARWSCQYHKLRPGQRQSQDLEVEILSRLMVIANVIASVIARLNWGLVCLGGVKQFCNWKNFRHLHVVSCQAPLCSWHETNLHV